jgi:hypothetical protein
MQHADNNGRTLRYLCSFEQTSYGASMCQSLAGRALDDHVTDLVLQAVTPPVNRARIVGGKSS